MIAQASAPSNIALIKYMGKINDSFNQPTNSSLSWTLENFRTFVKLTVIDSSQDEWRPLKNDQYMDLQLTEKSRMKFLSHLSFLKQQMGIEHQFLVESANNFPSDCGLASSASSFAALTMAVGEMVVALGIKSEPPPCDVLANLSQKGSGSSVRSFYGPWSLWGLEGVRPLELPTGHLCHQAVIVTKGKKSVSSTEAHRRVNTSDLFEGRPERAEKRLAQLLASFRAQDWSTAFQICWAEFWDMHALFETSQPGFGYMEPNTLEVLKYFRKLWDDLGDGPLITMDAGANVHALYREGQKDLMLKVREDLTKNYLVLMSGFSK